MTRYLLEPDAEDCPAIWDDETVTRSGDPMCVAHRDGDIIHIDPAYADPVWGLLTRVLAPDEATVERLAMAICDDPTRHLQGCPVWAQRSQRHRDPCTCRWSNYARRVLAALAAAPDPDGEQDEGGLSA